MGTYLALILCDGESPSKHLFMHHYKGCDFFAATDGAASLALKYGITPDVVIGDMDSFVPPPGYDALIVKETDQETNDLEKALHYVHGRGIKEAVVLGATGMRLDQTLKNLSVYKQFMPKFHHLTFEDDYLQTTLLPGSYTGRAEKEGTTISLFPLSGKVTNITTTGLKYSLKNEDLENGVRDGSSNRTTGTRFSITHDSGDLLMLMEQQHISSKF